MSGPVRSSRLTALDRWRLGTDSGTTAPWWWRVGVHLVVGAFLAADVVGSLVVAFGSVSVDKQVAALLVVVGALALTGRNRRPEVVLGVEVALAGAGALLGGTLERNGNVLLVVVALYVVATIRAPTHTVVAGILAAALTGTATYVHARTAQGLATVVPDLTLLTAAVAVGFAVRAQRALLRTFRERAEQAEREQQWGADRAVAAERVRIARELHDVVAHHVSLLVVQAGAVRETLPPDHTTRPVLDSMIEGGRRAMGELRDMLGALRLDEAAAPAGGVPAAQQGASAAPPPRAPQPTLAMVPALLTGANAAGLPVTLQTEGAVVDVPPAISLSAYRVVQEALTNAVKHAPGAFTSVWLRYGVASVGVTVRNGPSPVRSVAGAPAPGAPRDAVAGAGATPGGGQGRTDRDVTAGHGLVGMRERAAQAGGTLTAGPVDGGWEVSAVFPLQVPVPVARP